nr:retrovirus-related Pol polyprotein from transposon TNT 1-94 [Tanacetum cinerariifolium]
MMPESLYLAINILDRYIFVKTVPKSKLQLVGIGALLLSSKYTNASHASDNEVVNMEFFFTKLGLMDYFVTISNNPSNLVASLVYAARGGVLAESSQSSESSIRVSCTTCGSNVHSTTDHNDFELFRREQLGPKVVFDDNSSCITEGYGSINCDGIVFSKDRLRKFDAKVNDGYFLGYSFNFKAFRVFNTRRQQIEETYHVTFNESIEAIRNKKDEHGIVNKNKARMVAQGDSQEEGINYDETFIPLERMESIRIFLAFGTNMNFTVFQMDVKSAVLNGKLKEEVYVKQPPFFESSEFLDYVCKLDKALYGLKQALRACSSMKTPTVPLNNLRPDIVGKPVNETLYRGMISPKESHLIIVKRIFMYLKGTPSLGLYYLKFSRFDLKGYSDYADCNMDRKSTSGRNPQPQALGTTFEARVRDYMAAHTERIQNFENAIFKQREEINDRLTEMFGLLKELTTSRTPEKVLIREEAKFPVTKNVNSISLASGEEERSDKINVATVNDIEKPTRTKTRMQENEAKKDNKARKEQKTVSPFILGTPFLTTAKAVIKFDKGTITLRSEKSKISFHMIPESPYKSKKEIKNDIEPIAPIVTMNRLVLEWEEMIKLYLEREMKFNRWKSKNFKGKHPTLVIVEGGMDDEGEVT